MNDSFFLSVDGVTHPTETYYTQPTMAHTLMPPNNLVLHSSARQYIQPATMAIISVAQSRAGSTKGRVYQWNQICYNNGLNNELGILVSLLANFFAMGVQRGFMNANANMQQAADDILEARGAYTAVNNHQLLSTYPVDVQNKLRQLSHQYIENYAKVVAAFVNSENQNYVNPIFQQALQPGGYFHNQQPMQGFFGQNMQSMPQMGMNAFGNPQPAPMMGQGFGSNNSPFIRGNMNQNDFQQNTFNAFASKQANDGNGTIDNPDAFNAFFTEEERQKKAAQQEFKEAVQASQTQAEETAPQASQSTQTLNQLVQPETIQPVQSLNTGVITQSPQTTEVVIKRNVTNHDKYAVNNLHLANDFVSTELLRHLPAVDVTKYKYNICGDTIENGKNVFLVTVGELTEEEKQMQRQDHQLSIYEDALAEHQINKIGRATVSSREEFVKVSLEKVESDRDELFDEIRAGSITKEDLRNIKNKSFTILTESESSLQSAITSAKIMRETHSDNEVGAFRTDFTMAEVFLIKESDLDEFYNVLQATSFKNLFNRLKRVITDDRCSMTLLRAAIQLDQFIAKKVLEIVHYGLGTNINSMDSYIQDYEDLVGELKALSNQHYEKFLNIEQSFLKNLIGTKVDKFAVSDGEDPLYQVNVAHACTLTLTDFVFSELNMPYLPGKALHSDKVSPVIFHYFDNIFIDNEVQDIDTKYVNQWLITQDGYIVEVYKSCWDEKTIAVTIKH